MNIKNDTPTTLYYLHTSIHNFNNLFIHIVGKNLLINIDITKLIFNYGKFHTVRIIVEDVVE